MCRDVTDDVWMTEVLLQHRYHSMVSVAFGSHNEPCLYGSECLTLNSRCQADFCLCVDGLFFKQRLCGESAQSILKTYAK